MRERGCTILFGFFFDLVEILFPLDPAFFRSLGDHIVIEDCEQTLLTCIVSGAMAHKQIRRHTLERKWTRRFLQDQSSETNGVLDVCKWLTLLTQVTKVDIGT